MKKSKEQLSIEQFARDREERKQFKKSIENIDDLENKIISMQLEIDYLVEVRATYVDKLAEMDERIKSLEAKSNKK